MDPLVVTTVERDISDAPVLIIDRRGIVGHAIYEKIKKELVTAFVSGKQPKTSEQVIHIPYKHRIPEIPNGQYAMIIFIPDQEKDLFELVKKCIAKAQEDAIPFIFIVDQLAIDQKMIEKMLDLYEEAYVIIFGELFGQGNSLLDNYIIQAGTTRTIKLPFMGLREIHPVLFDDSINAILQLLFGIQKRPRVTFLYQHHTYTDLSIAHRLQKVDPLLHLDFVKEKRKNKIINKKLQIEGSYFFDKDYPVQERIIDVYNTVSTKRKDTEDAYIYREEIKPLLNLDQEKEAVFFLPDPVKKWGSLSLYYIFIIFILPVFILTLSSSLAASSLRSAKNSGEKGNLKDVRQQVASAHNTFAFDQAINAPILFELKTIGLGSFAQQLDSNITTGKEITQVLGDSFAAQDTLAQVLDGESTTPEDDIASLVSSARSSLVTLQKITTINPDEKELVAGIGKYQQSLDLLSGTVGLLPHVLASTGKHTYLILFQDNTELRPGGGFIGSYGLVTFDHGKMSAIAIHPVSEADDKLRQHVDPSFAVRRFMGTVHMYLHDSNFDPDFAVDAQKASDMLKLETGQSVDGVMGVDLTFVQYLLGVTGPISLPDQTVTADSFLSLMQQHAENPGANQKESFLNTVLIALQKKNQLHASSLFQKSVQALQEKHMVLALADLTDQNMLTANHVSSSLWDTRPQNAGTVTDYFGINEANIGQNKANYFIKRNLKQSVSIDGDGTLKGNVEIAYQNTSKQGEDYKNYLRVLLPNDTTLKGIAFDGQDQATVSAVTEPLIYEAHGFVPPHELEVDQTQEQGKNVYGFLVTIPANSTKTITLTYEHNKKINLGNPVLHYSLMLLKQPGTNNDPYSFAFNFPLEYSILSADPANGDGNSDYTLDTKLSTDKTITVDLTKK